MAEPFIYWRRGKAYFRRRVPTELLTVIGKVEWLVSLKTADKRVARQRALLALAQSDREIDRATHQLHGGGLRHEEIKSLADLHFHRELGDVRAVLRRGSDGALDLEPLDVHMMRVAQLESLQQALKLDDTTLVEPFADDAFVQKGLALRDEESGTVVIDRARADYRELCRELLARQVEAAKRAIVEASKAHTGIHEPSVRTVLVPAPAGSAVEELLPDAEKTPLELFPRFQAEHFDGKGHNPFKRVEHALALLEQAAGSKAVSSYTGKDIANLHQLLLSCPAKYKAHFGGSCTLQKAIEENAKRSAPLPAHATDTIDRHLSGIRTFYRWAQQRRLSLVNPAEGFRAAVSKSAKRRKQKRSSFTDADLKALFAWICEHEGKDGYRFWVPSLALYTGARLAEICQLLVSDVHEKGDVVWIEIADTGDGKSLKTRAARRIVPIHPELIAKGFKDYWASRQASGADRLFPDAPRGAEGRNPYNPVSQWFTRALGLAGIRRPGLSFHSFRHTWNEAARQSGVPRDMREALLGHSNGTVNDEYGGTFGLEARVRAIGAIQLPTFL